MNFVLVSGIGAFNSSVVFLSLFDMCRSFTREAAKTIQIPVKDVPLEREFELEYVSKQCYK